MMQARLLRRCQAAVATSAAYIAYRRPSSGAVRHRTVAMATALFPHCSGKSPSSPLLTSPRWCASQADGGLRSTEKPLDSDDRSGTASESAGGDLTTGHTHDSSGKSLRPQEGHEEEEDESSVHGAPPPSPQHASDSRVIEILSEAVPLSTTDDIKRTLQSAKNAKEVRHILEDIAYKHPLCFDVLNGHGYRVTVLQALTSAVPHTNCMYEWFDCVDRFRRLGFVLTRSFAAEGYTAVKQWISHTFHSEGRTPRLVTEGIAHIRELTDWCQEDALVFDHVLYTRIVFLLTLIVSYLDRQNRYRASFPVSFAKRDGIVVEWVLGTERCTDFDECVLQCDAFMEELLELLRRDIPSRPSFSLMYRLMDYYFATDNVEKLVATMEDAVSYGIAIAESSTAKLMQLACALNYPNVPELFIRWRVALPQCVLATPDMSRLMLYYGRSGGGRPCPVCGEPFNHRNVNVYHWLQTPPHQRNCTALALALTQKGELEECPSLPQNADWSEKAFALWELSRARAIEWGSVEWRALLVCCMFASNETALRAKALLDTNFDAGRMDDFLRATYMRLLRHHAPQEAWPTARAWKEAQLKVSPIALQEGLMAAAACEHASARHEGVAAMWREVKARESYVMPFTKRFFLSRLQQLQSEDRPGSGGMTDEEAELFGEIIRTTPRHVSLLDMKDSASDLGVGTSKKNVYIPPLLQERIAARRAMSSSRQHLHADAHESGL